MGSGFIFAGFSLCAFVGIGMYQISNLNEVPDGTCSERGLGAKPHTRAACKAADADHFPDKWARYDGFYAANVRWKITEIYLSELGQCEVKDPDTRSRPIAEKPPIRLV